MRCATCNAGLSFEQRQAGNGEFCDTECARSYPVVPEGRTHIRIQPGDLASAVRELTVPEDLANWQRQVWQNEWEELGLDKPIAIQVRLQAANWLTERGYGKAPMFAPVEGEDPMGLTDADREIQALEDELAGLREKKLREQTTGADVDGGRPAESGSA